jgi:class 3 adenylate cyclase
MPTPMVLKTPFLVLLLCFMASHISAARPLITIWASLSVVAGWWLAREVILADPHTITAANLVLSHYKTYLELARVAGQPHFFNGGVWSIHFRELFIFGAILAFAAYRVHHLAIRTARQAALRDALGAHFAPQVAELMAKSSKPGLMRWSKELAVIDCDMISFTALAEKSEPEHVAEILQAYRNVVEDAVFDAGGAIVSYAGDGATAVFGLTDGGAPAAVAALDCAQQIANGWPEVARIILGTDAPAVAIGVDFGAVRAGLVGEGRALSLLLLGEPVAGAAELQAMTRDVSAPILLSEAEKQAATAEKPGLADNLLPVDAKGTTAWGLRNG